VPLSALRDSDNIYNIIEEHPDYGTHSGGTSTNALIIKDIPLAFVNDIQAIVLYNRNNAAQRALGLIIEFYNTEDDPSLIEPLSTTNPITLTTDIYRYDFPAIDTYTEDFDDSDSLTNIISVSSSEKEDAIINDVETDLNINCNVTISGELICNDLIVNESSNVDTITTTGNATIGNDLTLAGTQINFNSDSFISNSAGGNSGNHLVIFINGTEYKIKLENAS